ncbi:VanZ family protein [Kitasatospora sp. NPDC008050]|uniref:VanZ family protein n=1 Tax=Kitasatospora sp. NPDC008050 TaxID=3364021 RepID=UPI0036E402AA
MRIEDRRPAATARPLDDAPAPAPTAEVPGGPAAEAGPDLLPPLLRSAGLTVMVLYFLLIGWLALRQAPAGWSYDSNLTPFASVHRALTTGGAAGLRQVASELVVLAPLGVLMPLAGGRLRQAWLPSFLHTLGINALIATAMEVVRTGLTSHLLNVDDIVLGTIGAAAAHLLAVPVGRVRLRAWLARHPWPDGAAVEDAGAVGRPETGRSGADDAPAASPRPAFETPHAETSRTETPRTGAPRAETTRAEAPAARPGLPGPGDSGRALRLLSPCPGTLPASVSHARHL